MSLETCPRSVHSLDVPRLAIPPQTSKTDSEVITQKVLQGSLNETRYKWPEHKVTEDCQHSPLQVKESALLSRDDVTYISDNVSRDGCKHFGEAS